MTSFTLEIKDNIVAAERRAVNSIRDDLLFKNVYVVLDGIEYEIEADEASVNRLRETIDIWRALALVDIKWTMADNSRVTLTYSGLCNLLKSVVATRGRRALQLHDHARRIKENLPGLPEGWDDVTNWPT